MEVISLFEDRDEEKSVINEEEILVEAEPDTQPQEEIDTQPEAEPDTEPEEEPDIRSKSKKKRKKGRVWKIIGIIFGVLFLLLLIGVLVVFIIINSKLSKINRTEITGNPNLSEEEIYETPTVDKPDSIEQINYAQQEWQEAQKIPVAESKGVENILLIGSDRRGGTENGRSDTIILMTVNYDTKKIHTTSFMRAMYVCIPRADGNVWGMINAAYSWGGPNLLIDTIELNFRVDIDHYVVVDFAAFEKAVDLVGGIDVELSENEATWISWVTDDVAPGKAHLNSQQALAYSRMRYFDNDFKRTERQRIVINKVIAKAKSSDINTLMKLADEILPLVYTDIRDNGTIWGILLKTLPFMGNATAGRMLPIENESGKTYTGIIYVRGQEMYKVNFEENIKALHAYINS